MPSLSPPSQDREVERYSAITIVLTDKLNTCQTGRDGRRSQVPVVPTINFKHLQARSSGSSWPLRFGSLRALNKEAKFRREMVNMKFIRIYAWWVVASLKTAGCSVP